jgi:hypothetical protein
MPSLNEIFDTALDGCELLVDVPKWAFIAAVLSVLSPLILIGILRRGCLTLIAQPVTK